MSTGDGRLLSSISYSLAVLSLLYLSCAEVVPPPGGEEDRTPPSLLATYPDEGAVLVPLGREISIYFSEPIARPDNRQAIFISPRQAIDPDIQWKKDQIVLRLAEDFAPDQTYIVSMTTEVTDLRRNRLTRARSFAFSTGASIDSGVVAGRLVDGDKPLANAVVGLYPRSDSVDIDYDSVYPGYVTTSNKEGEFVLSYLPPGSYRLIGFLDGNRNDRFNPLREKFLLPDRPIEVGGEVGIEDLVMGLTSYDTTQPQLLSASVTPNRLLRLRLSALVLLDQLRNNPALLSLARMRTDSARLIAEAILEDSLSAVVTAFIPKIGEGEVVLTLLWDSLQPPLIVDSLSLSPGEDEQPPEIISFEPSNRPQFANTVAIRLLFSEPLDTAKLTGSSIALWEDSAALGFSHRWIDNFRLSIKPERIKPGAQYKIDIMQFDLVDLAGNLLGDSLSSFSFSTLNEDSLGTISGAASVHLPGVESHAIRLTFTEVSSRRKFQTSTRDGQFSLRVPPGKYLLSGFIDQDGDAMHSLGRLYPFTVAETQAFHPDTVVVRARFETAGVQFDLH